MPRPRFHYRSYLMRLRGRLREISAGKATQESHGPTTNGRRCKTRRIVPLNGALCIIVARGSTSAFTSYYFRVQTGGTYDIQKWVALIPTVLKTGSITLNAGDVIYISVQGGAITVKQNGTVIDTATDTDIASGTPGLFILPNNADNEAQLTNWIGGDFAPPNPTSISPSVGAQGATLNVTVNGAKFDADSDATLSFSGTGITVNSYSVRTATQIIANITIDPAAATTARNVTVTNPSDGQTGTLAAAFTVTGNAPPIPSSGLVVGVLWGASGEKTWITGPSRIE